MNDGTCSHGDQLAAYSLGELGPEEGRALELHLETCPACRQELATAQAAFEALAQAAPEVAPPPRLWARIRARILEPSSAGLPARPRVDPWKTWAPDSAQARPSIVRSGESAWEPTSVAGIEAKRLAVDVEGDRVTMLVRMAPGSAFPGHRHAGAEECYVLSGDLCFDDQVMHAGDYQLCPAGSSHSVQSTVAGCVLLLVSSRHDERA